MVAQTFGKCSTIMHCDLGANTLSLAFRANALRTRMSGRIRPAIGLLIDALYNEYGSALVAAFEAASLRQNVDLVCFAGGTLYSQEGSEPERNRCYDLVSSQSLDGVITLAMSDSPSDHA